MKNNLVMKYKFDKMFKFFIIFLVKINKQNKILFISIIIKLVIIQKINNYFYCEIKF